MWDSFRKAAPKIAAFFSAVKAWGNALWEGESLANANRAAADKYDSAVRSNRFRGAISQGIDQAREVVESVAAEFGLGVRNNSETTQEAAQERKKDDKRREQQTERRVAGAEKRNDVRKKYGLKRSASDDALPGGANSKKQKTWAAKTKKSKTSHSVSHNK